MITSLFCQVFRVVGSSSHQLKSVVIHESDFMCQMLCSHGYDLVLIFDHPHMFLSLLSFCIPISVGSLFHIYPTFHGEVIPPWIRIVLGQWIQGYGLGLSFGWHWNPSGISFYRNICVVVSNFFPILLIHPNTAQYCPIPEMMMMMMMIMMIDVVVIIKKLASLVFLTG